MAESDRSRGRKLALVLGFSAVVLGAGALLYDIGRTDGFNSVYLVVIAVGLAVIASARKKGS